MNTKTHLAKCLPLAYLYDDSQRAWLGLGMFYSKTSCDNKTQF